MKDKRLKYFQIAALLLIGKRIKFKFETSYLEVAGRFDISLDANDKSKIWIEQRGDWTEFTDPASFKSFIEKII